VIPIPLNPGAAVTMEGPAACGQRPSARNQAGVHWAEGVCDLWGEGTGGGFTFADLCAGLTRIRTTTWSEYARDLKAEELPAMSWTADLDPHYDRLWSEFERGLAARQVLDGRTRLLVLIGECVVLGETDDVVAFTQQALDIGVPAPDIH